MTLILIIISIISILSLIFYISFSKINEIKNKISFIEKNIEDYLKIKCNCVNKINNETKSKLDKKNYFKDYVNLEKKNLTNIELDIKLDDAFIIIKELKNDIPEIKTKEFNKIYRELKSINEKLYSSKKLYNKYASISNQIIRKFPNNIIAKIIKYNIRAFYNIKEK